ncbi:rRNA biogenesis protein RRP5 [Sesamum angolense]|uniref:rRNA biogenesis protein RRP5 n=1 Tax=Sesamum angolense TaxID=2727404 RepID=A0AAE1WFJ3_9LAMI|nr:rRNA biogenesis protein RRP5 [Sesamum angolense]
MAPPSKKSKPKPNLKNSRSPSKKPAKAKGTHPNPAVSSLQMPVQVEDDVPDFPRGRGSLLSGEERNEVRALAEKESRADERVLRKRKKEKRAQNRNQSTEDDLGSLFGDGIIGKLPRFANKITLKNVSSGMKLWGVIAEVNEKDIVVSLPGGLRGLVRACDAIDPILDDEVKRDVDYSFLSRIYHEGQLVSCIVLQVEDDRKETAKRKIWLSLRLSLLHKSLTLDTVQEGMVLSAYAKSIEDHGFILHFGLPSFTGFMPKHNQSERRTNDVSLGQVLQGVVKSIDRARKVVYLSSDHDMVSRCVTRDLKGISIDLLVPGMMVNAHVQSTLENGIMLSFLTYFTGTVDVFNLDKTFPSSNWKNDYAKNMKTITEFVFPLFSDISVSEFTYKPHLALIAPSVFLLELQFNARILFIDPSSRAVGLTLNPHLVSNKAPSSLVKIGDIFDQSKVVRVDKGSGLLLEIPTLPAPTPAYVNVADIADKEAGKLDKSFKEGSLVRVRVLGYRHLEGLATGDMMAAGAIISDQLMADAGLYPLYLCELFTSAFEGSVFTHSDVKPGMVVKAKVIAVDSFGAIVQFASGVKALCPLRHMSEFEIAKPRKKFQIGLELVFRVLGCKSKRITVTHKKTLLLCPIGKVDLSVHGVSVKSKLQILSSYADATDGLVTHGWITKIEKHGCFVRFYNGVQGFAPRSELGLGPGSDIGSMYHVEQVVKCRVVKCIPASHRINLSFNITPTSTSENENVKPGSLVSGVVEHVTPQTIVVDINTSSHMKGTISTEHLADHYGLAALLMSSIKPGYHFDQLLVLDVEGNNLVLTAKYSLVNSIEQLPADVSQIRCHSVVHGYVCNIIDTGCFVRFIGRLTGFAPKTKATDDRRANLSEVFYVGQSVRSNVVDVSSDMSRITLSLKQSLCCSTDASFIQEYFLLEEKIAKLQVLDSECPGLSWTGGFGIASIIEGKVHEIKDFGVVISFEKYNDVYGFISHYQLAGTNVESNSVVRAAVLDVSKIERLVDLSLKPEFINRSKEESSTVQTPKKKRRREAHKELEMNQIVSATVEIVKENYLVLSLPAYNFIIGYASATDYNTQKLPAKQFTHGQSVSATVMALPTPATGGRLLLLLASLSDGVETSRSKRAKKNSGYDVGSLIQAEITEIKPLEVRVKFGSGFHGRIHVTEATDDNSAASPFSNYRIGQTLAARIVSKRSKPENIKGGYGEDEWLSSEGFNYSYGQRISGFVYKVDTEWAWLTVSRDVNAQLYILDSSCEPPELAEFQKRFYVGKALTGYVISVNKEKKLLRIVLHKPADGFAEIKENDTNHHLISHIVEGSFVGGRISKILPGVGGLLVQIDHHHYGKVHFTELKDSWVSNPLMGYHEGQIVKCKVLEINRGVKSTVHVDLSLRSAPDGSHDLISTDSGIHIGFYHLFGLQPLFNYCRQESELGSSPAPFSEIGAELCHGGGKARILQVSEENWVKPSFFSKTQQWQRVGHTSIQRVDKITDLHPDMVVRGYVKNISSKGCFIMLSRKMDAKILLCNLSDSFVENPENEFPVGKLVIGKVLSVEPLSKRVEVTLKTSSESSKLKSDPTHLNHIVVGDIISGRIKRVESYGLFIAIDHTNVVGLCHVSELSDDHIDDPETAFKAGERMKAKVLKVDKDRNRVSLGMKSSYIKDEGVLHTHPSHSLDFAIDTNDSVVLAPKIRQSNSVCIENINNKPENHYHPILADAESRALVPPLEVPLDEIESLGIEGDVGQDVINVTEADTIEDKNKRRAKKKGREEREQEIRTAEERLLEKDIPRNADDFEKLIRSSPNSSFIWIKYMAYMLSLADIEKARSVAERLVDPGRAWIKLLDPEYAWIKLVKVVLDKGFENNKYSRESEKLNMWVAYFNLENEYGNPPEEAVTKVFQRALQYCDPKKVHLALLGVYERTEQHKLADELLDKMTRKFKHSCKVWLRRIQFLLKQNSDGVQSVVNRALLSLPRHKHIKFISQTAILEFKCGVPDRGRSMFEGMLREYPKRTDLWSIYLDQFLFKKYLEYEKSVGDEERIESVKKKAMEYVENTLA